MLWQVSFFQSQKSKVRQIAQDSLEPAVFAKNFDQVNWVPSFVLTPLTYFGGVFYSVSLLPEWAQR